MHDSLNHIIYKYPQIEDIYRPPYASVADNIFDQICLPIFAFTFPSLYVFCTRSDVCVSKQLMIASNFPTLFALSQFSIQQNHESSPDKLTRIEFR